MEEQCLGKGSKPAVLSLDGIMDAPGEFKKYCHLAPTARESHIIV